MENFNTSSANTALSITRLPLWLVDRALFAAAWFLLSLLNGAWQGWRTAASMVGADYHSFQAPAVGGRNALGAWYLSRLKSANASATSSHAWFGRSFHINWLVLLRNALANFVWALLLCSLILFVVAFVGLLTGLISKPRDM